MNKPAIAGLLLYSLTSAIFAAEVKFSEAKISDTCASIEINGEISQGDADKLGKFIAVNKVGCRQDDEDLQPSIMFNSPGGDVGEALVIGRLIRSKSISTSVNHGSRCISACTLAFLGGVSRSVNGAFGIHRPYAIELSDQREDALASYDSIRKDLRAYAEEMRVSTILVDRMLKISPQNVVFLSISEMRSLGVTGRDAVWEDQLISREAKSLGISRREYLERRAKVQRLCAPVRRYPDVCGDKIMRTGSR